MVEKTVTVETFSKDEYEDMNDTIQYLKRWASTLPAGKESILRHVAGYLEDYLDIVAGDYEEEMTKLEYLEMVADREEWKD